jgi:hypothetical protein
MNACGHADLPRTLMCDSTIFQPPSCSAKVTVTSVASRWR